MKLKGKVVRVKHASADGFAIIDVEDDRGKKWTCKGTAHDVGPDSLVEIEGDLDVDPKWGPQVKIRTCRTTPPVTRDGAAIYLSEAPGISEVVARRIVEALGDDLWPEVKAGGPRLAVIKGVGPERAEKLAEWCLEREATQEAHIQLAAWGLNRRACREVIKVYKASTLAVVHDNPWRLAEEVSGVGFATADDIALKIGRPFACVERARAGLIHHMAEDEQGEGHCYSNRLEMVRRVSLKLPIPIQLVKDALVELEQGYRVCTMQIGGQEVLYRTGMLMAERFVADDVVRRARGIPRKAGRVVVEDAVPSDPGDAPVEEEEELGDTSFDFGANLVDEEPPPVGDADLERFAVGGRR